jgi:hypothetical protein
MVDLQLNNENKSLEKLLSNGSFIKTTETNSSGTNDWGYDTFYSPTMKCRIEYNTFGEEKGYNVYLNVSDDIEDTIDCEEREWFTTLKSLETYLSK